MDWFLYSWPTLILLCVGLRMALHLHYGARGPEPGDPIFIFLNTTSWVLIVLGTLPALLLGASSVIGLILLVIAATALVETVIERRATRRRSMCTLLALLMGRGQQLDSNVLLTGPTARGAVGRAMRRLLAAVRMGMPLAAAIERYPAALPREAVAYVAAGETIQAETAALKELSRTDHAELATIWRTCIDRVTYLGAVLLVMSAVITFLMIKIVPEFRKVFYEFDLQLPLMTELAIGMSQFVVSYLAAPLFLLAFVGFFVALAVAICYLIDVPVLAWLGDLLFRARRNADVLRILAVATENRQPLAGVLARLANVYPSSMMRLVLGEASRAVAGGADWRDALADARIVSPAEQGLLKTAERVGNLPWALRTIAARNERRSVYRLASLLQVLYPLVIVFLAGLIGFFVVALFLPLVKLIENLTG